VLASRFRARTALCSHESEIALTEAEPAARIVFWCLPENLRGESVISLPPVVRRSFAFLQKVRESPTCSSEGKIELRSASIAVKDTRDEAIAFVVVETLMIVNIQ
jgi:hypothetical protein